MICFNLRSASSVVPLPKKCKAFQTLSGKKVLHKPVQVARVRRASVVKSQIRNKSHGSMSEILNIPNLTLTFLKKSASVRSFDRVSVCSSSESAEATTSDGISEVDATANVAKSIMGAGCFALPWAYARTGTVFTSVYMVLAAALCMYCVTCMQRASALALASSSDPQATKDMVTSYSGLATATIGGLGGQVTQLMVLVCCFGIASAYLVFVASTLATVLPPAFTQDKLICAITPVMVALSWLRSFAGVSLISLFGNISVVSGMVATLVYAVKVLGFNWAAVPAVNVAAFPAAFGSVAFLFFVHFTMPPIEAAMARPKKFFSSALQAFLICTLISAAFGTIGAACFGPGVASVVITDMKGASMVAFVKLLLCANLLCTFPIIVRGAFQILEGFMGGEENLSDLTIYGTRTLFVVAAAACGIAIPSFGKLLGLVGGVSCTALTMIFPPLMLLSTDKGISFLEKLW
eukprot:CAMPEP_0196573162 /NCGR_PEP_ID=MMETSP1081-20130531/3101_1 /TAXON_ID=36882 /ORGANISM="Pyramimonas amylifera, Strain CCMP720" /LENGTH=463 /DNA_ID=CAMNT_0041890779 /DNA_START=86 /DNA_END=1474 /DNA_ORIENTATION=-